MENILISFDKTISYSDDAVKVNDKTITDFEGSEPQEYAKQAMRDYYKGILSSHFENLIILTGSGSSVGIGIDKKGQTMKGLWNCVIQEFGFEVIKEFCEAVRFKEISKEYADLEALLSQANTAKNFINDKETMVNMIEAIQKNIRINCTLKLPSGSPHEKLLDKTTARKLKYPRMKLFTLNYDTLFEQAASKNGYIVIDGFSFTYPRRFNGKHFDYDVVIRENSRIKNEENYAQRVFHLYKPHGSLDWEREDDYIKKSENAENPVMIYPKNTKYESSYEQPFFEMMSRFQQAVRQPNTFLITIGFSFYDKHISSMIFEALNINPSFRLMVINPDVDKENFIQLKEKAKNGNNVFLVSEKFDEFVNYYPYPEIYRNPIPEGDDK